MKFVWSCILLIAMMNFRQLFAEELKLPEQENIEATHVPAKSTLTLGVVDGESDDKQSWITVRMSGEILFEKPQIEEHGTFLQIKLPGVIVPNSGAFLEGNSPYIRKMAAFQTSTTDAALRVFVTKDAAKVRQGASVSVLKDRLILTVDHDRVEQLMEPVPATAEKETKKDVPALAPAKPKTEEAKASPLQFDVKEKMISVAGFFAVLAFGALALYMARPLLRSISGRGRGKKNVPAVSAEPISLKMRQSLSVGPKQRLCLVEVGGENLLIGITPDGMQLISKIGSHAESSSFAKMLTQEEAPQLEQKTLDLRAGAESELSSQEMKAVRAARAVKPALAKSTHPLAQQRAAAAAANESAARAQATPELSKLIREKLRRIPA